MKKNKIGIIFLVPMLAIAGIGISYAGFTDVIHVYGTVDTATVDIDWIGWYSGTWVYKIWGFTVTPLAPPGLFVTYDLENELLIYRGFKANGQVPLVAEVIEWAEANNGHAELVSYAAAEPYVGPDDYQINMVYDNLFPCINFTADFIFHYGGSIPAKINVAQIFPLENQSEYDNLSIGFLTYLWNYSHTHPGYGAWVDGYFVQGYDQYGNLTDDIQKIVEWREGGHIDVGTQLHYCDYVLVRLTIHLPQDNLFQGLTGHFSGKIGVIQWYDNCPTTPPTCPPPEFTMIDLEVERNEFWQDVQYYDSSFYLTLPMVSSDVDYNMTLGTDTATNTPLRTGYHVFYLVPPNASSYFWDYWAAKGVHQNITDKTSWQWHMWLIINGGKPLFYVKYDATGYILVDGLHRDYFGSDQYFTIPDDYPEGMYNVKGHLVADCGSSNTEYVGLFIQYITV